MLISPHKHIRELKYLIWDLTGTIDAMPLKLGGLSKQERKSWAVRYREMLTQEVMGYHRNGIRNMVRRVVKDCLENGDEDLLTIIKEIGKGGVREGFSQKERRK